ncbi:hypothetical protein EWM64_g9359 [Hericium alpestre]|uniref:Uncharacterized protein n=1 Tax=Hericium alpestre TaxID=135208 RepID=A0A4Y9ZL36_9AGAM|nr:hypothetical protein EWM64_g9359 [Hericium alpestre]
MADPTAHQYICDCQKYCHGTPTALSQHTYQKHTEAQLPIVPFSDFLALQQMSSTAPALSEPTLAVRKHPRTEHEGDGICIDCKSSTSKQPHVEQPAEQSQDFFESHLPGATVGDKTGRVTAASPSTPMASPELAAAHVPMNMDEDRTPPSPTPIPHSLSTPVLPISFPDPSDTPSDTIDEDVTDHLTDTVPAGRAHDEAGLDLDLGSLADLHLDDEVAGQPSGDIPEPESWIHIDDQEPTLDDIPSAIEDIQIVQDFIKCLQSASLDNDNLPPMPLSDFAILFRTPPI